MLVIMQSWREALSILIPSNLFAAAVRALRIFGTGFMRTVVYFPWIVAADILLFLFFGDLIIKAYALQQAKPLTLGGGGLALLLVTSVVWFVITIITFLFMRGYDQASDARRYVAQYFLRYIQLSFFFSLVVLVGLMFLLALGISHFPSVPWWIKIAVKVFSLFIAFYWLDSNFSIKDMFLAVESSINLIVYRLPHIIVFLLILVGCDYAFSWACHFFVGVCVPEHVMFIEQAIERFLVVADGKMYLLIGLGVRYIKFFIEGFLLALMYDLYLTNKDSVNAASFFDEPSSH